MEQIELGVPEPVVDALPADADDTAADMQQAAAAWEARINEAIDAADSDREAAEYVADAVDRMEDRRDRYDDFVPELRAWGQSPIYAMAWRSLYANLIAQLYERESLADALERERNARLVEDGIRWRDVD